jgi:hypothetical protein
MFAVYFVAYAALQFKAHADTAGRGPDVIAAKAVADMLCSSADVTQLRVLLLDHDWILHPAVLECEITDEQIAAHLGTLREAARHKLHRLLDNFEASFDCTDVLALPITGNTWGCDAEIWAYFTAPSIGYPIPSYDAWDVVYATEKFPHGWSDRLGAALGLLHPHGAGPATITVTLYAWS